MTTRLFSIIGLSLALSTLPSSLASAQPCIAPPSGFAAWWPGDGSAEDIVSTNTGVLMSGTSAFSPGKVGKAFYFDGFDDWVNNEGGWTSIRNDFTIAFWSLPTAGRNVTAEGNFSVPDGTHDQRYALWPDWGGDDGLKAGVGVSVGTNGVSVFEHAANHMPSLLVHNSSLEGWTHVVVVLESKQPKLFINGAFAKIGLASSRSFVYPPRVMGSAPNGDYGTFSGLLDEVGIFSRALSSNEIAAIYAAGSAGMCKEGPFLAIQPGNQTVPIGSHITFKVMAKGTPPFSYQWLFNGVNMTDGGRISGANTTNMTISNVQMSDADRYSVVATNATGSVASSEAILTVIPALVSGTETRLVDYFPKTSQGEHGIFLQYLRSDGTYENLINTGDYAFTTPGMPWNIPRVEVSDFNSGSIYVNPSAVVQVGAERDAIMRVTLWGDYGRVRVRGHAEKTGGSMRFYVYQGAGNYAAPLWQAWDGGAFDLTVPYLEGDQLFFAVDAGPNDVNDWAFWRDIRFQGLGPDAVIDSPVRSGEIVASDTLRFAGHAIVGQTSAAQYSWDFGDGRASTLGNPGIVSFAAPGVRLITLDVIDNQGRHDESPATRSITVIPDTNSISDLVVTQLSLPGNLAIGQPASIPYTVRNAGDGGLSAKSWKDALYLSRDAYLDVSDQLLVSAAVSKTVAVGGSYTNTLTVTIPTVEEGAYYLLLSVDDEWQFLERPQLNNEFAVATDLVIPRLTNAVPFAAAFAGNGDEHYFRIDVPAGQNLLIRLNGLDNLGASEVYVRFGALPTRGTFDYRAATPDSADQQVLIPAAAPGTYYILVRGESVPGNGQFTLEAIASRLNVTGVTPDRYGQNASAVLTISGAGFDATAVAELVGAVTRTNTTVSADSFTQLTATFNLSSVPVGRYSLRVSSPFWGTNTLADAFEVLPAGEAKLETQLIVPSQLGYHAVATIWVQYANTGHVAMPAPLLVLTATQNGQEGAWLTLQDHRLVEGFWTSAQPEGFSHSIQILASGNTPGVLQPGESVQVPVYYAGWQQPWDFTYQPLYFFRPGST
ncbi:MAG: LamG-like jellyroll fold domain-containing protein [Verrucomicrobiota bacterium]